MLLLPTVNVVSEKGSPTEEAAAASGTVVVPASKADATGAVKGSSLPEKGSAPARSKGSP